MPVSRTSSKLIKLYNLNTKFAFGKYIGVRLGVILDNDPDYVVWVVNNVRTILLSNEAMVRLKENLEAKITMKALALARKHYYNTEYVSLRAVWSDVHIQAGHLVHDEITIFQGNIA